MNYSCKKNTPAKAANQVPTTTESLARLVSARGKGLFYANTVAAVAVCAI